MGLDGFQADVGILKSSGKDFARIGKAFSAATTRLKTGLTALEEGRTPPWGDDEMGENFGIVYEGLRDGMYDSMTHLATKLGEIGGALQNMGAGHQGNEDFTNSLMEQEQVTADQAAKYLAV